MSPLKYSTTVICAVFIAIGAAFGEEVKNVFGEVGGTVSFRPTRIDPSVTSIAWKQKNSSGTVVKAIEWDADDGVSILNQRFKHITTLDEKTGQITITNVNIEHSGIYIIEINSKEQEQKFKLEILPPLPKPEIKIEKSSNPNAVYLKCEYSETIIWKNSTGGILKGSSQNLGELITVEKRGYPNVFYTCTLKNAVRETTSDPVYERELFAESVLWWIFLIVLFLILIAALILFILLYVFWPKFHDNVEKNWKDKPCIGAFLHCLDRKKKHEDKQLEEVAEKSNDKKTDEEAEKSNGEKKQDEDNPSEALLNEGGNETSNSQDIKM